MAEPVHIVDHPNGTLELSLFGDIDLATSPPVQQRIREAIDRARPATVYLNLAAVTFLDSTGIGLLVRTQQMAARIDAGYVLDNPTPAVYEHLRLVGLTDLFEIKHSDADRPGPPTAG